MKRLFVGLYLIIIPGFQSSAQEGLKNKISKNNAFEALEAKRDHYKQMAFEIWNYAELGYHEQKSSALLQDLLLDNGFAVEAGVK